MLAVSIPLSVGGIDQPIRIEVFGELGEFGSSGARVCEEGGRALVSLNSTCTVFTAEARASADEQGGECDRRNWAEKRRSKPRVQQSHLRPQYAGDRFAYRITIRSQRVSEQFGHGTQ